ncbi:hypothetical protein [Thiohalorhabdus methylotrophus]|uniref:Exonuclease n=1 Tax=Thiohalorhabdus methylotrophus TaxID=3242694 RepID=A0ABV4TYR8_9GAMM
MPVFLDFEASSLGPESYPLEVAWGNTETGVVAAHLIDPTGIPEWAEPIDPVAHQMHGLSRDHLAVNGAPPDQVMWRMKAALGGRTTRADRPCEVGSWDVTWPPVLVRGPFYCLFLIPDLYPRKIEQAERSMSESRPPWGADVVERAVLAEGCSNQPTVAHSMAPP